MQLRELLPQYAPCRQQGICYFGKFLVAFNEFANARLANFCLRSDRP